MLEIEKSSSMAQGNEFTVKPILGGLHHEYSLEKAAA